MAAALFGLRHFRPFRPQLAACRPVVAFDVDQDDVDRARIAAEHAAGFPGQRHDEFAQETTEAFIRGDIER